MSFNPFQYRAWVKKLNWKTGQLVVDRYTVYDGDSGWVLVDRGRRGYANWRFRLYGVDTPEVNDKDPEVKAKAYEARDWLREQIEGKEIFIVSLQEDEKYGRLLVIIWTNIEDAGDNAKSINKQMIDLGLAKPYMGELI